MILYFPADTQLRYHRKIDYVIDLNLPITRFLRTTFTWGSNLPTAWLVGATKAEAAATRREKRKKERILIVLLERLVKRIVCHGGEDSSRQQVEGPEDRRRT